MIYSAYRHRELFVMSQQLPGIDNLDVAGKKVLVRVDFNVPLDQVTGEITDDTRIIASLPTLEHLLKRGAAVIIVSHLGRPKGEPDPSLSLEKAANRLQALLKETTVSFCHEAIGEKAAQAIAELKRGQVLVLENIRFYKEETSKEENIRTAFAKKLCKGVDIYVDDAFGSVHRAHASIVECAQQLPGYAGFLLQKEVNILEKVLNRPERPFVAIIGGSKISSKLAVIESLLSKVDTLLIGGAMAYTFLKGRAIDVGNSMIEREFLSRSFQIVDKAVYLQKELYLPEDHIISDAFSEKGKIKKTTSKSIPDLFMGMDIGPKTIDRYTEIIRKAKTVLWNGPMGVFEMDEFAKGTFAIAKAMAKVKGTTIVGGGDSVFAVKKAGLSDKMTYISTGGGATLEYLEGKKLPGVAVLLKE